MKRLALCWLIVAFLAPAGFGQTGTVSETLFRAMTDEIDRTVRRLEMEDLGKPYFVGLTVRDSRSVKITSSFGGLQDRTEWRSRDAKVDLRVGRSEFDNTHFAGSYGAYAPARFSLVVDDDYDALRCDLWSACDAAYKNAQFTFSKKKAYKQNKLIREEIADLSTEPVQSSVVAPAPEPAFDAARWEEDSRKLSAVFKAYPAIQKSQVTVYCVRQQVYFVDSEGRKALKPDHIFQVIIEAATQAKDGRNLAEQRHMLRRSPGDMPDISAIEAEAVGLAKDLTDLAEAPLWEGVYIGPVLIEGQAAGEFFNQLLARNVSFPRSIWIENEGAKKDFLFGVFAGRLGLRVVSPILSVVDDPSLPAFDRQPLVGHYTVDDEGIPAQRVSLIEKGILKDVLMSRSPIKERTHSNGHGRAAWNEFPNGRIGNLVISTESAASIEQMKDELRRRTKEFGLKYGMILRRMACEDRREKGDLLAPPVLLYKAYVDDGHEELVRNAEFNGVTLRALRDIVLASQQRDVYNCRQQGYSLNESGMVAASIVHPSVLVSEMEFKQSEKKPETLPYLKHPFF